MLRVASFLADNARPLYGAITRYLGDRLATPATFSAGVLADLSPWLDAGAIDVAFLCGWPYAVQHDRADSPIELLCAPVMAGPRYGARPVYFTDAIVRHDHAARAFADLRGATWAYNGRDTVYASIALRLARIVSLTSGKSARTKRKYAANSAAFDAYEASMPWPLRRSSHATPTR